MLKPSHQIFGSLHSAPLIKNFGLGLNDPLLGSLALPANVIYLLLQGATIDYLAVQGGLKCFSLALQLRGLGLGIRELLMLRVVGISGCLQLPGQGLNDSLQRGNSSRDGFCGRSIISSGISGLASLSYLPRTSGEHFGRYADFRFKSVISDAPGPLRPPCPRCGSAGTTQA